ncbi:CRIB domain-containing protein RIC7-like [Rhododendron vialii]|uniref:CRIB domain-containing protein RIC7-like n=1 Tax=Rhododendron vialii TaxID=182163 RepID=UPI00265E329B|nr:CRIB domain-containing protein RIC7-like [Rhododendron vialii]
MGTKMKGLLKGLRYITQIFDEEKEPEMQIGNPTDVKHVAHIGWDGQSSADSPSWMEDFKAPQGSESVPLPVNGDSKENPENKGASSEGSSRRSSRSQNPSTKDIPELPKSTRRHSLEDGSSTAPASPRRESSTRSRQSRRNTSDGSKPARQPKGLVIGSDSPSRDLPDVPKKSSRKKAKDPTGEGSTRSSRSKAHNIPPVAYKSPFSDPGPNTEYIPGSNNGELAHSSSFRPLVREGEKGCNGIS